MTETREILRRIIESPRNTEQKIDRILDVFDLNMSWIVARLENQYKIETEIAGILDDDYSYDIVIGFKKALDIVKEESGLTPSGK